MDGRRHSVDFPISRALYALQRVRSLRDPSTNSLSKLSALVDHLDWETKSSSAIILGFENNDNNISSSKRSSLFMADDDRCLYDHGSHRSMRNFDSRLVSLEIVGGSVRNSCSDARVIKQEMVCLREENHTKCRGNGDDIFEKNSLSSSSDCVDSWDSYIRPKRRSKQSDHGCRGKSKCKKWNMKNNRLSRVRAGDALSPDANSCLSAQMDGLEQNGEGITPCFGTPRSLCEKFMPKSFKDLVGQNVVAESLLSAIYNKRIASLYLFHGPRGTGKTSAARIFAAALNCLSPEIEKPCGLCQDCVLFFSGRNTDVKEVDVVEINKTSRLRSLIKNLDIPPIFSRFKAYIVDDCHLLRGGIWGALFKKMEELPLNVVFVMITSDIDKLPSSVVSKAERYDFQMVKVADIAGKLRTICEGEGVDIDEDALNFIATKSNGSVRDAETMLDQLSLLAKKITIPLVHEVNGVVSDAELLDLLCLALSSDASNTIKKVRELIGSRIDPLQLVSQLAGLVTDILSGKCVGVSDIRSEFGLHKSDAELEQLRHALKILSETEKQLRTSKNQTTWLTVALLQLSSAGASHDDEEAPRLSTKILHPQECESRRVSTDEYWKHPVTSICENDTEYEPETLELIWNRAARICESSSVKNFLQKRGKLASVRVIQGVAVADLEFDHPDHVSRAEKSWKVIAGVLQRILGYNVELRINLANNAPYKHSKLKTSSLNLFSCSRRVHLQSQLCVECGSSVSDYSTVCHGNEAVTSIRNSDGNALSIGIRTPRTSFLDSMDRENVPGADSLSNRITNRVEYPECIDPESRSRRKEFWKLHCWRTITFPFRKVQTMWQNKLC